ncbi:putative inorganic phosphate cotransporter [Trichogramma pretiosum]|uniref:putative inorganic phosphate cotransporter n=1 Tax=Trichogramma pretiosum TaxID=7493 RepID=UPI0006C96468|nr:putative inorganic phosphate cotransporter [Trichogramma pretiosum]
MGPTRRESDVENIPEVEEFPKPKGFGKRYNQVFLLAASFFLCYAMRVVMNVTIVAMTSESANPRYDWSAKEENLVLSTFFMGYVMTQIPGGMIARKRFGQFFFGLCVALCGVCTMLIPFVASQGVWWVCGCRIVSGLCQGVVMPTLHTFLSNWAAEKERSTFVSIVYGAGWFGNVCSFFSTGLISSIDPKGWEYCFELWGGITLLWAIGWMFYGRESPNRHSSISVEEKNYIMNSRNHEEKAPGPFPWKSVLSSGPVYALLVAQCSQTFCFWMLATKSPEYLDKILKMDLTTIGTHSGLPYFTAFAFNMLVIWLNHMLVKNGTLTTRSSRMLWNGFGMVVPALCILVLGYTNSENSVFAIFLLYIGITTNITIYSGHHANHLDLSTNYAGLLMAGMNTIANCGAIAAPLVHGAIVTDPTDPDQWKTLFSLTAAIWLIGAVVFQVFGSTERQPWDDQSAAVENDSKAANPQVDCNENHIELSIRASGTHTSPPESDKSQTLIT